MQRIGDFMTRQPWTVQLDDSLGVARRMMAEQEIHHLPVVDGGVVVGMVTERDLTAAADHLGTVADVLMPVHTVSADTTLGDVVDRMTENRWDAVVVTDADRVVGIFTASDALRVLADLLHRRAA